MYQIITLEDEISVHPTKFNLELEKAIEESVSEKYEGKIDLETGVALAIVKVDEIKEGKVLPGDPSVHYPIKFQLLTLYLQLSLLQHHIQAKGNLYED